MMTLTRRRLLLGVSATALAVAGFGRAAGHDTSPAITVFRNPT